jgi:MFS transporter, ACS family, aldohexuronate transporter
MARWFPAWARLSRLREDQDRYRWYALSVTTFTQAASAAVTAALGPIAPLLMAQFAIGRAEIGLIQTSVYLSASWSAMVGGRLADRAGERSALIVSGVMTGVGAIGAAMVGPFWAFLVAAFVLGLGTGVQNPAGSAAVMRWFPPRRRGFAMGIRQTGVPVGGVLAATAWPWVAAAWGWRSSYALAGAMALFGTALIALTYFDPRRETGHAAAIRSMRDIMGDRQLWLLALTYNGQIVAQYSVTVYLVLFLHEALGFSLIAASALLALVNAVAIGGRIGWGWASDAVFGGARRPVLLIIIVLTLAGMLMAAALPRGAPLGAAIALAVLLGVSAFSWTGMYGTLAIELAGSASAASAVAWVHMLGGVGSLGGPPLFGYLVDHTGSYRIAWLAAALAVLGGLAATLALREGIERRM